MWKRPGLTILVLVFMTPLTGRAETGKYLYVIELLVSKGTSKPDMAKSNDFFNVLVPKLAEERDVEVVLDDPKSPGCPKESKGLCDMVTLTQRENRYPLAIVRAKPDGRHGTDAKLPLKCSDKDEEACWKRAFRDSAVSVKRHHHDVHQESVDPGNRPGTQ